MRITPAFHVHGGVLAPACAGISWSRTDSFLSYAGMITREALWPQTAGVYGTVGIWVGFVWFFDHMKNIRLLCLIYGEHQNHGSV